MSALLLTNEISLEKSLKWLNDNQGVLSLALFCLTIVYGWFSGIFGALRQKPKFDLKLLEGPTFVCTFATGEKHGNFDVHRTGIALYLKITNIGSSASAINDLHLGYKWSIYPFSMTWVKYKLGWFWLKHQSVILTDFQVMIGENIKFYPFLTQKSPVSGESAESYLEVGRTTSGVVYFEQDDSFGACFPYAVNDRVKLKLMIIDSFGIKHTRKFVVAKVLLAEARKFNPNFGMTLSTLRNQVDVVDFAPEESKASSLSSLVKPH